MPEQPVRIAMWSGPRNISTALLRSWENRPDTVVVDEPFYAYYLAQTGADHPGREEVIAAGETDWQRVAASLVAALPDGVSISYQKHMAHHLLDTIGLDWLDQMTSAFLIRDPAEMLTSLAQVLAAPRVEDTGLPQQAALFERMSAAGATPVVVDARDVLQAPEPMLRALCEGLGVPFSDRMLSWPAGPRDTDGIWARWWYDAVIASTGFAPYRAPGRAVPPALAPVLEQCRPYYERLYAARITI